MKKKRALLLALGLAALLFAGCAYNHKNFDQAGSPLTGRDDFVIQLDDYGQIWDRAPATAALARVRHLAETTNVIVVLFVHGWNHDAAADNPNLVDFSRSLNATRQLLTDPNSAESRVYRQSRKNLTDTEDVAVVGIYVGWRGRSLPSVFNYATFWGRKAAAERVGQGDLREFLFELNDIYQQRSIGRAQGGRKHFMGLTAIGHSFGAQVLFKSVAADLENQLILATSRGRAADTPLAGYGDLVVLVNPAFEAMQFERMRRLSGKLAYSRLQGPVLLVVSSAGDVPRQVLFPLGRHLDSVTRPGFREGQRELWTEALGEYEPYRTHSLEVLPEGASAPEFDANLYLANPCAIATYDLSNVPKIARVKLEPTTRQQANNPFVVAYASTDVVLNHSKVFEDVLRKFLADYVAIAQGKRIVGGDPRLGCK